MDKSDIDDIIDIKDRVLYALIPVASISMIAYISWIAG